MPSAHTNSPLNYRGGGYERGARQGQQHHRGPYQGSRYGQVGTPTATTASAPSTAFAPFVSNNKSSRSRPKNVHRSNILIQ